MNATWQKHTFPLVMTSTLQFIVLTIIAMLVYPGGTLTDPTTERYSFFTNFFSDLGTLTSYNGSSNLAANVLFATALTGAGLGLIYFFAVFPMYFQENRYGRFLSLLGSVCGVITGLGYIGVAFTPADQFIYFHILFVQIAFSAFLGAAIFYTATIFTHPDYPNQYAIVYILFAVLLAVYLWLIFFGPDADTLTGVQIQATGQKIIVYAAILTMFIQAYGAHQFGKRPLP